MSEHTPNIVQLKRRDFIKLSGMGTASLVFALALGAKPTRMFGKTLSFEPNLFVSIKPDGRAVLTCHRSEMGQGIRTSIALLLADELEIDLALVSIEQADGDEKYGDQNTDGSRSIRGNWERLRLLAAAVRMMFVSAAAKTWAVSEDKCHASLGAVFGPKNLKLDYKDLLTTVASLEVPKKPRLKDPKEFRYIGKEIANLDGEDLIKGKAIFGMDVQIPGMVYASLRRSPLPEQKLLSFDALESKKVPGVLNAFAISGIAQPVNADAAVAVVAENTWAAFEGVKKLKTVWQKDSPLANDSSDLHLKRLEKAALQKDGGKAYRFDQSTGLEVKNHVEMVFKTPFLVHAPMEPLVATAHVTRDSCEVWAPTQDPQRLRQAIATFLHCDLAKVSVHVTFLGGGFGRKAQPDFGLEAVAVSQKIGKPVKVVWSREDEIKHGFYHPAAAQRIRVGLGAKGQVLDWLHHSASATINKVFSADAKELADWELALGATTLPYDFPQIKVLGTHVDTPLRIGWLRSVNNVHHSFAINSVIDELAQKAGEDPIEFSLKLLGKPGRKVAEQDIDRLKQVILEVRELSSWTQRLAKGSLLGFAHHWSFGAYLAYVVEVAKSPTGGYVPVQVDCVMDCGQFVNASAVKNQIEGSVAFGLSIAYHGQITYENGSVSQSNFHDYPVIRAQQMPPVRIKLLVNAHAPQGVGEPGVPAFIPALTNAISRASGVRIRELPYTS